MKAFDWQRMALDKVPVEFLAEVALRSLYTFVLVFIFLKITAARRAADVAVRGADYSDPRFGGRGRGVL